MSLQINPSASLAEKHRAPFEISQSIEKVYSQGWAIPRRTFDDLNRIVGLHEATFKRMYAGAGLTEGQEELLNRIGAIAVFEKNTDAGDQAEDLFNLILNAGQGRSSDDRKTSVASTKSFNWLIQIGSTFQEGYFGNVPTPARRF